MTKVSKYFTLKELTYTNPEVIKRLGISNEPTPEHKQNLITIANELLDKVREMIGGPLAITSGYRSKEYNAAIPNSSLFSQHMTGHAVDLDCDVYGYGSNDRLYYIIRNFCEFDQLIWEFGDDVKPDWVHVSYVKGQNRKKCLKAVRISGQVHYLNI